MRTIYFVKNRKKPFWTVCQEAAGSKEAVSTDPIPVELIAIKGATRSFANKLLAEKTIELEVNYLETHKGESHE